jgi:hypothetical protein
MYIYIYGVTEMFSLHQKSVREQNIGSIRPYNIAKQGIQKT